jgi:hypothetical protein
MIIVVDDHPKMWMDIEFSLVVTPDAYSKMVIGN